MNGSILTGVIISFLLMFFLWCRQLKTKNAGTVDLGWTLSILIMAISYFFAAGGNPTRRAFIFFMVFCWATRLSWHLVRRFMRDKEEDPRYRKMRSDLGGKAPVFFLFFFLFQAFLAVMLSTPFLIASVNADERIKTLEIAAFVLWFLSFLGESAADAQLKSFKADPANRGQVCDKGLWNYSRHPNYFFECLIWFSFFLFASGSPQGIWTVICPILMTFFITKVSGVPPAEAQSLLSRGDKYRAYQATTSVLIPWFKKRAA